MEKPATRIFRFAPSPNGCLHLGHALSAILNFEAARACGGRFLLRIEDIDRSRARPDFEAAIFETLAWLGLAWETPVRRQSEHFGDYAAALERLAPRRLIYSCTCTRGDIARRVAALEAETGRPWPRDPDGAPVYPGTCRERHPRHCEERSDEAIPTAAMSPETARTPGLLRSARNDGFGDIGAAAWRLDMTRTLREIAAPLAFEETGEDGVARIVAADPAAWGDVVLARKDVSTSYHLSVVVDDALQAVTDVIRGRDLFAATSVHRLLQALLGLPTPRYSHHRLVADAQGEKLAKSRNSPSLRDLRAAGWTPDEVRRALGLVELRLQAP